MRRLLIAATVIAALALVLVIWLAVELHGCAGSIKI